MPLRRISCETGDGGQTVSPNVRRLVGFFIVVCLASAAGISRLPSDAEKLLPVGDAEPRNQIKLEDAEDTDLLPRQPDAGTSITDSEQGPQQKYFLPVEDATISDSDQDMPAADGTGDAGPDEDPNLRAAPKYMLELYRKFSNDKYSHPIANIVRSFLNINTGVRPIWTMGNRTRIALHTLLFNISSINRDEEIYLAELRLYAAKKTQRVLVYEVVHQSPAGTSADGEDSPPSRRYQLLMTREIPRGHGDWETFSVTEVVRRWVRTQATAGHILEVRVDTARPESANDGDSEGDGGTAEEKDTKGKQEEDEKPIEEGGERNGAYEPILVVFSNDRKRRKIELRELHEIQSHENGMGDDDEAGEYQSSPSSSASYSSPTSSTLSGGEEEEEEYDDEEDRDGVRLNATTAREGDQEELDDEKRYPHLLESLSKSTDRVSTPSAWKNLPRRKRSLNRSRRRRAKKNACRRKPMWVDFNDVQWDRWIIEPRGYQAYECTGQCYFPVGEHLTPTKYAMIKSLLHATYPKKVAAVCCVPTRLEPISLLYVDEHGIVTYKYKYDGMVVAECGCR